MTGIRRALMLSTGERYVALAAGFLTMAIVSRILTPTEIGVAVVGMAIVGLAATVREFSGANLLVQRPELSRGQVRTGFTVMAATAIALASVLALAAPTIASLYSEPRLAPYLQVVAASLLLETPGALLLTLLRRDMAFGRVALVSAAASATVAAVTIALAALGFSYMSFAFAWLAGAAATTLIALALRGEPWIFRPRFRGWRDMLVFGGYNGGTLLACRIYDAAPYLVLGRVLGLDAAAIYFRSVMICQLPDKALLSGAAAVVLPAFSAEARAGRELKLPYLRGLELLTAVQWPALVVLAALAHPVVDLLLGDQWRAVAPLVQILALASLFAFTFELNYPLLIAVGAIRDVFLRAAIVFPVGTLVLSGAAFLGLEAVAWSMMLVVPFHAFVALHFVRRRIDLRWAECGAAVWRSGIVALAAGVGPLALALAAAPRFELSIAQGAAGLALAGAGWAAGLALTRHPLLGELAGALPPQLRPARFGAA